MPVARANRAKDKRKLYNHSEATIVTRAATGSASGRIRSIVNHHASEAVPPDEGNSAEPEADMSMAVDIVDAPFEGMTSDAVEGFDFDVDPALISGIKIAAKRYSNSKIKQDDPLLTWINYRDNYLDALLSLEGRGMQQNCASCGSDNALYRCRDCHGHQMICRVCLEQIHAGWQPLHVIEVWHENRFQKITNLNGGSEGRFSVQLGHLGRERCPLREAGNKDFTVLHTNGIHSLSVYFCGCREGYTHYQQLLDAGWFPATVLDPQTCATFEVMRHFHTLNLQGKISAFDYYVSLKLLTDATGLTKIPDRLSSFMVMVREWRHLKAVKRAGRAHDISGIKGTAPGSMAIPCRACPQPKINLPDGWENAPAETSWLYRLILSQDANFRLKNRLRSSDDKDPSLGPGYAYFLASDEYLTHLANYINEDEISHCVGFAAMWAANKKKSKGLRATGVASVSCARHQLFRRLGTGDLQKGERYSNMDGVLMASMAGSTYSDVLICYDIACQYGINFFTRIQSDTFPEKWKFSKVPRVQFKVPKFHLPPHKHECHGPFSLNYTAGVGRTDGEGVERNWSWLNGVAPSTSQMGPGARHDTLDDFMGFYNYRKTVELGDTLLKNLVKAIPQAILHRNAFRAFTDGLRKEHLDDLRQWEKMRMDWEKDPKMPDPYLVAENTVSVSEIRLQLAEEDYQKVENGGSPSLDFTPSGFIIGGLALEADQMALRLEAAKKNPTPTQEESIQRKRTALLRKFLKYCEAQRQFMPKLPVLDVTKVDPEFLELRLPSSLPSLERVALCTPELIMIEDRLRVGHLSESLSDLRHQLRTRTFVAKFRDENAKSQASWTRMRTLQDQIERKIRAACDHYRLSREALLSLRGPGKWEEQFCELKKEDIRSINERTVTEEEQVANETAEQIDNTSDVESLMKTASVLRLQTGEGSRSVSWIWYGATSKEVESDADGSLHDSIRLEWMKARARAERWREEVILLEEEMRRVLQYCGWQAEWWDQQARSTNSAALDEGLHAFAAEQAFVERARANLWCTRWAPVRQRAYDALQDQLDSVNGELLDQYEEIEVELDFDDLYMQDDTEEWSDNE
ncbi:hypothetical protein H0H92_015320 [Tricholoma furcatifolium]|nr:hypothetical protein H0H92_015320 [Tricholoma furcatifolium]